VRAFASASIGEDEHGTANVFQYEAEVEAKWMNEEQPSGYPNWEGFE
jgi:hypothetical protein